MKRKERRPDPFAPSKGIRLFRDEIEYLIGLIEAEGDGVQISDDENEYESIDEFIEIKGDRPRNLLIGTHVKPYSAGSISIQFRQNVAYLNAYEVSPCYYECKEYLVSHSRPAVYFASSPVPWLFASGVLLPILLVLTVFSAFSIEVASLAIVSCLLLLSSITVRYFYFGVHLTRRHHGGFFRRNAERFALIFFGALLAKGVDWLVGMVI